MSHKSREGVAKIEYKIKTIYFIKIFNKLCSL